MTIKVHDAPADQRELWRLECSDDEPEPVRQACAALTDAVQRGLRNPPRPEALKQWIRNERNAAPRAEGKPTERMRKALYAMARDLRLDRDDRLLLAEVTLDRDIESWSDLSFEEASRLLDVMTGYINVRHLRLERSRGPAR